MKRSKINSYFRTAKNMYNLGKGTYDFVKGTYRGRVPAITRATRGKRGTHGVGVTTQFDKKTVYVKRRMPRRRRRQWAKFSRKVRAVNLKTLGTDQAILNSQAFINMLPTQDIWATQMYVPVHLYGRHGSFTYNGTLYPYVDELGTGDLYKLFVTDYSYSGTQKILMKSAILDVTFNNTSTSGASLEVDAYEIGYWAEDKIDYTSFVEAQDAALANTPGSLSLTNRGVTLFDLPLLSRNGMKIYKKTKYILSPGQAATYQIRDPKNRVIDMYRLRETDTKFMFKGMTRTVILVAKGIPTTNLNAQECFMRVGATRTYKWCRLQDNTNSEEYANPH